MGISLCLHELVVKCLIVNEVYFMRCSEGNGTFSFQEQTGVAQDSVARLSRNSESMQPLIDVVETMTTASTTSSHSLGSIISSTTGSILSVIVDVIEGKPDCLSMCSLANFPSRRRRSRERKVCILRLLVLDDDASFLFSSKAGSKGVQNKSRL